MKASLKIDGAIVTVDLSKNFDLSIPVKILPGSLLLWESGEFKTALDQKGKAPESNSIDSDTVPYVTHTVCIGCITPEYYSINRVLTDYVFCAEVISVVPESFGEDYIISRKQLKAALKDIKPPALVIRTLPNTDSKRRKDFTGSNWVYLEESAAKFLAEIEVKHLLIDLPSIDKENSQDDLPAHKAFWQYPENPRIDCTITELIYVPNEVEDGSYLLNLLMAPFDSIAGPSKPILYPFLRKS